jgi:hypothetical protein
LKPTAGGVKAHSGTVTKENQGNNAGCKETAFREAVRRSPSAMQNKSLYRGPVSGLANDPQRNNLAGTGICAFPCRVDNTGAQWLDADSLIRLPLRGQRGFCLAEHMTLKRRRIRKNHRSSLKLTDKRTDFPIKSSE